MARTARFSNAVNIVFRLGFSAHVRWSDIVHRPAYVAGRSASMYPCGKIEVHARFALRPDGDVVANRLADLACSYLDDNRAPSP